MAIKTNTFDRGDDDWRFDRENPPEQWTRKMFGRLSLSDMLLLKDPDNGILSSESQASFNEVSADWSAEVVAAVKPVLPSLLPDLKFDLPSSLFPNLPKIALPTIASNPLLDESIRKSRQSLLDSLDASKALGTSITNPAWEQVPAVVEPTHHHTIDLSTTSVNELKQQTSTEVEHLAVLESIREVLIGQERAAARGAFFYILIGLATTLAGIATLVTMTKAAERWWTVGITAVIGLVSWVAYAIVKAGEKPKKNQAPQ